MRDRGCAFACMCESVCICAAHPLDARSVASTVARSYVAETLQGTPVVGHAVILPHGTVLCRLEGI
jgi:hypothetical protein